MYFKIPPLVLVESVKKNNSGTYALSSGYYDEYYLKGMSETLVRQDLRGFRGNATF